MTRPALDDPTLLPRLRSVLAARFGLHFDARQDDWLTSALRRLAGTAGPARHLKQLEQHPTRAQLDALAAEVTVGETFFFRHPEQFDALRLRILPDWLRRTPAPRRLRVLSAGCASGEEPYTLAITLLRAGLSAQGVDWDVQAFDLNPAALTKALAGRYREWSLRSTTPDQRSAWFRREGEAYTVLPAVRSRVHFSRRHIALPDPLFWAPGQFDVIFCRNMLMYLGPQPLQQALRNLTTALAPGGVLFLGHSETLRGQTPLLTLRQAQDCFFYERVESSPTGSTLRGGDADDQDHGLGHDLPAAQDVATSPAARSGWPAAASARAVPALGGSPAAGSAPATSASASAAVDTAVDTALSLIENGQLDDGLSLCSRLTTADTPAPIQAEAFFIQALALEERGELPAAEWNHQRAAAKDAAFAMPHLRMGLLARRRGELVAARRELGQALILLEGESPERLRRFGGGFERDALLHLCRTELGAPSA